MAILTLNGIEYLTDNEVIKKIDISNVTFYSWIKKKKIISPDRFNHRGWRLWNKDEIGKVIRTVNSTFKAEELSNDK